VLSVSPACRTASLPPSLYEGKFVYAGFCGTGLPEKIRAVILEELRATHRKTYPFPKVPAPRDESAPFLHRSPPSPYFCGGIAICPTGDVD
jgi:ATP-dependent DNA ligase